MERGATFEQSLPSSTPDDTRDLLEQRQEVDSGELEVLRSRVREALSEPFSGLARLDEFRRACEGERVFFVFSHCTSRIFTFARCTRLL